MPDESLDVFSAGASAKVIPGATEFGQPTERRVAPVPDNLLGTTEPLLLQMAEDANGSLRAWEVQVGDVHIPGKFDAAHLRDIHAHIMQDIYPAPGATRGDERLIAQHEAKVNPEKELPLEYDTRIGSNGENITLLDVGKVNKRLDDLSSLLERENTLQGLDKQAFVGKLADYYTEYSHAAPFRAGNEHVLGVVMNQIGKEAGYVVSPAVAQHLREATDATLEAGVTSDKSRLIQVFSSVTSEAPGRGAEARRDPTQSALPLEVSAEIKKRQAEEDMGQAGAKLIGRVGGQEEERFKTSMRALIAGDSAPEHINVVRTTALKYGGQDLAAETKRIEQGAAFLDNYRRGEQQQDRQNDQAQVSPRETGRTVPNEITR
ncbi:Fic family protein [Hymenobacter sp. YC55]|uniref:Fic family protein n=1 Tax=Hymenobacter sp. YC55 TaxID=3034019 RepID=UPI0023F6C3AD|nr:Fic family protein [Hymenobacter sp. YC55]MDF7815457.1 Fic family protein [Hymenobacter sp. YC55]